MKRMIKMKKMYMLIPALLLAAGAVLGAVLWPRANRALAVSGEITNWGLSFQQEGQPPVANATADYLAQFDSLYCAQTQEKLLYITFDAGFENGNTEKILDALKNHGVKATFFLVGNYFETQPELVRRMVEEGHTIGNHTYSHPDMSAIGDQASFQAGKKRGPVSGHYRRGNAKALPAAPGEVLREQPENGPGPGLPHGFLEPGLCGLVPGRPAHPPAGL